MVPAAALGQTTATYVGPDGGVYSQPLNWDVGQVPLDVGTNTFNVIVPNNLDVIVDVVGQVTGLSAGTGSVLLFDGNQSLAVLGVAVLAGTIDANSTGASFMANSQFATFDGSCRLYASQGAFISVAAPSYALTTNIGGSMDVLRSSGAKSTIDLSTASAVTMPLNVGGITSTTYTISATNGGLIDLSGAASIDGANGNEWLRLIMSNNGVINLDSVTTIDGRTRVQFDAATYALPSLQNVSNTVEFNVPGGGTLTMNELTSFNSSELIIADSGAVAAPLLTDFSKSIVRLNPSRTLTAPPFVSIDNARLSVEGGATLAVAATGYTVNQNVGGTQNILLADGAGSALDFSTVTAVQVPVGLGGCCSGSITYSIAATNGGLIDLSNVAAVVGAGNDEWLRFLVDGDSNLDLTSVAQVSGRTRFDLDTPFFELPALTTVSSTWFDLDLGTMMDVPALATMTGGGNTLTVPVFALLEAPALTSVNGTTIDLSVGGMINAPNLQELTNSLLTLSPGAFFTSSPLINIDDSRIRLLGGAVFSVAADSYVLDQSVGGSQDILSADGPGTLLDLSSLGSLSVPINLGGCCSGSTVYSVSASAGGQVDLSGLDTIVGAANDEWLKFTTSGGGVIDFGPVAVSGRTHFDLEGTSSTLDFAGDLNIASPAKLTSTLASTVRIGGDHSHNHTAEVNIDVRDAFIHMNGSGIQNLEVAGEDIGLPSGAVMNNFEIGQLRVGDAGQPTTVRLVDLIDNGNRAGTGSEALYLQGFTSGENGLRIHEGSTLVIGGIPVYATETDVWIHVNELFGPGENQIEYDEGFIVLSIVNEDCNSNGFDDLEEIGLGISEDCNSNGVPDVCEIDSGGGAPGGPYFCTNACAPDCNVNGTPDECDIALGDPDCDSDGIPDTCQLGGNDCDSNGVPDQCDADCNTNAIPDACESFGDCNVNSVPDECEIIGSDCNSNGVLDECDVALGTSSDCNANSTPDSCEPLEDCNSNGVQDVCDIAQDTSSDCDGNQVPDDCEIMAADCNGNGALDICDISSLSSTDYNGDLTPDDCQVVNVTRESAHASISEAVDSANLFDILLAATDRFEGEPVIDFDDKPIELLSRGEILQLAGGLMTLADGARLAAETGSGIAIAGDLLLKIGDRSDVDAEALTLTGSGKLRVRAAAVLDVAATSAQLAGSTQIDSGATLAFSSTATNSGTADILGGTLVATSFANAASTGLLSGYGTIESNVINNGDAVFIADTAIVGDYENNGDTTIIGGTLTVTGNLTNNGTIGGETAESASGTPGSRSSDGVTVLGEYHAGVAATMRLDASNIIMRVGSHFDSAINEGARFDMAGAELRMVGSGGTPQNLEVMSEDRGPQSFGLQPMLPGNYPLAVLYVGPTPTTVNLVDNHDNDSLGQEACEALYVRDLIIAPGATLNTGECRVYYLTKTNNGMVDDPGNLVQINPTPGDVDADGDVDLEDYAVLAACLFGPDVAPTPQFPITPQDCLDAFDTNSDGDVDLGDVTGFQFAFQP